VFCTRNKVPYMFFFRVWFISADHFQIFRINPVTVGVSADLSVK